MPIHVAPVLTAITLTPTRDFAPRAMTIVLRALPLVAPIVPLGMATILELATALQQPVRQLFAAVLAKCSFLS